MIEIQINGIDEIVETLNRLATKTENKTDLIRNIAGTIESEVLTNFDVGDSPTWLRIESPTQAMLNLSNLYFSRKLGEKKTKRGSEMVRKSS